MSINIWLSIPRTIISIFFCYKHRNPHATFTLSLSVILLSLPPTQASAKEHVWFTGVVWSTLAETGRIRDLNVFHPVCALCYCSLISAAFLKVCFKGQVLLTNIFYRLHFYLHPAHSLGTTNNLNQSQMQLVSC